MYRPLLQNNPYIKVIHTIDEHVKEVSESLKAERFDHVIDLHKNLRSNQVRSILKTGYSTFNKINIEKWLKVNTPFNRLPDLHVVDRYFEALKPLSIEPDREGIDYFFPKDYQFPLQDELPEKPYMAMAIGGKFATKKMPPNLLIGIVMSINQEVVLVGGQEDADVGKNLKAYAPDRVVNFCGRLNFDGSAFALKSSHVILTHDTGMMHISSAFDKPIVAVWGNTIPAFGMHAYKPKAGGLILNIEQANLKCRPCSKLGFQTCPKKHFNCMERHNPVEIAGLIDEFFA